MQQRSIIRELQPFLHTLIGGKHFRNRKVAKHAFAREQIVGENTSTSADRAPKPKSSRVFCISASIL